MPDDDTISAPPTAKPDDMPTAQPHKRGRGPTVAPGTAVYLTEAEIIRALQLPERLGRAKLAMWRLDPTFPKPEPGLRGRRFWPSVEKWVRQHHGLETTGITPVADGAENFDGWRKRLKTRKANKTKERGDAGPGLPSAPVRMAPNVVATIGPRHKRLSKDDAAAVAPIGIDPSAA